MLLLLLAACAGTRAPGTTLVGAVADCPRTPNCVSTAAPARDAEHHAEPLRYEGSVADAKAKMKAIVAALPRTALVEETDDTLRFTFTSRLFRFVDDVDVVFVDGRVEYRMSLLPAGE